MFTYMTNWVGLERCAGEVVTDMLNIIETCDPEEAQMRLVMRGENNLYYNNDVLYCYVYELIIAG